MKWRKFIQRVFTEADGNPSSKRLVAAYGVLIYSILLLSAYAFSIEINEAVIHMADMLLGTSLGTYVVGRFAEKGQFTDTESTRSEE